MLCVGIRGAGNSPTAGGAQIAAAFELLRIAAPGAAYLFARTLVNVRPLLDDPTMSNTRKIEAIQAEIDGHDSRADAGISVLAMKSAQRLLDVAERDVIASYGYSAAFGDIAKAGKQYRALVSRDRRPPADEGSRRILAKEGRTCVAEVADAIMAECKEKGGNRRQAEEDIATILAFHDLRDEASSGRLLSALPALEATIDLAHAGAQKATRERNRT